MENQLSIKSSKLYIFISFLFLTPLAIRNPLLISDGGNYIRHPLMNINFSQPYYYTSPAYWGFVKLFEGINPWYFVFTISLVISLLTVIASTKILPKYRALFIFLCLLNPSIFNISQVSLRNGLALTFILLALGVDKVVLMWIAPLFHPGTLPIVIILTLLRFKNKERRFFLFTTLIVLGMLSPIIISFINTMTQLRGYDQDSGGIAAGFITYFIFILISILYWLATPNSHYRWFMPICVLLWIIAGTQYQFSGRIFFQSNIIFLFIVLSQMERNKYRVLFLMFFFLISVYIIIFNWHPLLRYSDGWLGYWLTFI